MKELQKMFDEARSMIKKEMGDNITDAEKGKGYIEPRVVKSRILEN